MKKINDVVNNANSSDIINKYQQSKNGGGDDGGSIGIVNWLFSRLRGIIPAFFVNVTNESHLKSIKLEWLQALQRHGINSESKLEAGIQSLVDSKSTFLPPVMTFIEGCKPSAESLGLPSVQKAYEEACRYSHQAQKERNWSHDAVFHAKEETGAYFLSNNTQETTFPVFKRNYEITIDMLLRGEKLREIPKALEKKNYMTINDVQFQLHGRNAMSNIINYQCAGGKLGFKEFEALFKQQLGE